LIVRHLTLEMLILYFSRNAKAVVLLNLEFKDRSIYR
jgi:hypothetical protein